MVMVMAVAVVMVDMMNLEDITMRSVDTMMPRGDITMLTDITTMPMAITFHTVIIIIIT